MASLPAEPAFQDQDSDVERDEEDRVGLSKQTPEAIVKAVRAWWKESADRSADSRKRREEAHKMKDGDHWEQTDKDQAKLQKRPAMTFNMILSMLAAVSGEERDNRQQITFFGTGQEDDPGASRWNKLLKWVMDTNGGEFETSDCFDEMLTSGEGWLAPELDTLEDPAGVIKLECVDNEEIWDDPLSTHPVGLDARYRIRVKMLSEDEGEAMWPGEGGFKEMVRESLMANAISETDGKGYPDIYLAPNAKATSPKIYDCKDKLWAVIQCFWWEIEPGYVVLNEQTGVLEEMSTEEFEEARAQRQMEQRDAINQLISGPPQPPAPVDPMLGPSLMPQVQVPPPLKAEQRPLKKIYEAFVVYDQLLECNPIREKLKMFPIVPMRGIRRKSKKDWVGLVEGIADAQKQHNVEQSTMTQWIMQQPKNAWMAPKGAYHNRKDWETGAARPGKLLEYNAARGKPEQIESPAIPRHILELAGSRIESMRQISGVNVELTGVRQGSDAGVVMERRSKAAQTVLAPLFDNARRTRIVLGKVLLAFMQAHLTPGRQVRVLGPDGQSEAVMIDQQMLDAQYDLKVDETESTVNDRIATLNIMQTTLPQMMKAGVPVPPEFVDLLPIEPHIRDAWKRLVSWQMTISGQLPPPGWEPGMPVPIPGEEPGAAPGAPPPSGAMPPPA